MVLGEWLLFEEVCCLHVMHVELWILAVEGTP